MRDVISIRACRDGSRIGYSVVDEYNTTFRPGRRARLSLYS
jgi:VanZ family protein